MLVRNINFSRIETLDDTADISKVEPVDLRVNEARIDLYDLFGATGLDLAAGELRIAWGTADGVNPTDRVNALDLEDGAGFDKRLPSPAIQLALTLGPVRLEAAVVPLFTPALLPIDELDVTALGDPQHVFELEEHPATEPPEIRRVETHVTMPEPSLKNMQYAARLVWHSPVGDFSGMFYRGFESLPQASGEARLTGFQTENRVDLGVPLVYPRLMMAGLDYRGPIVGELSAWAEIAVLFPEEAALTASQAQLEQLVHLGRISEVPDPLPSQETQDGKPYVQAVAGLEYLFPGSLYANLQYARGMPTERQAADVHDYALLALRLPVLDGRLQFEARGALEVGGADAIGWQGGGAVSWLHGDAARLTLSSAVLGGQKGTTFQRFERVSNLKLAFTLGF